MLDVGCSLSLVRRANGCNVRLDTPTAQTFLADMLSLAGAAAR